MNWRNISARERRTLLLGAVIALPVLAWRVAVQPYRNALVAATSELADARERLSREREIVASAPNYPAVRDRLAAAKDAADARLFSGPDDLTAASRMVASVAEIARDLGLQVDALESGTPEPTDDGLVALSMTLRATSDLEGVLALLDELENGEHLVLLSSISVERAPDVNETGHLTIAVRLRGFARQRPVSLVPTDSARSRA
ncbi:MAG: type II secretion system protein GspM [Gemmatimonadaceae bacterium]